MVQVGILGLEWNLFDHDRLATVNVLDDIVYHHACLVRLPVLEVLVRSFNGIGAVIGSWQCRVQAWEEKVKPMISPDVVLWVPYLMIGMPASSIGVRKFSVNMCCVRQPWSCPT